MNMKKFTWITLIAVAFVLAVWPLTSQAAPLLKLSWRAEYYDNNSLSGAPKLVIYEPNLSHDWGNGSPALEIPADNFSARYTIIRHFEKGTYLFLVTADDGARVWLDGNLIIDAWDFGYKTRQAKIFIDTSGDHELQVAYFEKTGKAYLKFEWLELASGEGVVGAWKGEYFTNKDLAGTPTTVRQDGAINFDWNSDAPDPKITRDNFSVRWTRSIYLKGGVYRFRIQHDDGMRLSVDGKIFYDSWYDQSVTYQTRDVPLKGGYRTFVVEYYDHVGNAVAMVSFDGDPDGYTGDESPDGAGLIVDNSNGRFTWGGPTSDRYVAQGGYGGSFFWTYNATDSSINFGKWTPGISAEGNYEVYVYIPGSNATTANARYRIVHFGQSDTRVVNQSSYNNEWVSLGVYYFKGGGEECILLYDDTGEATASTRIAFDAIQLVKR
jgi:hypothetical protein